FLQALVFLDAEQDERLTGAGVDEARRGGLGVLQRSHLLFGQFDHGRLLPLASYQPPTPPTNAALPPHPPDSTPPAPPPPAARHRWTTAAQPACGRPAATAGSAFTASCFAAAP